MMVPKALVVLLVTIVGFESVSSETSNIFCYYGTWAHYRSGNGAFKTSNIDTSLCTHLIYTFIGLQADGTVVSLDEWLDYSLSNLVNFNALKTSNSAMKTLVAIGGWNQASTNFSAMVASETARAAFIQNALTFVQTYGFDGFDFDWEYPALRGGVAADIENFVTLLKEFKAVFEPLNLLVTAAVSASKTAVANSYNVAEIAQYLDFINVMAYDLHGYWDGVTGHHSPLYASSIDTTSTQLELNVDACITNWIAQGADPAKIVLGIPFYGKTFTLTSSSDTALGAAVTAGGPAGPYTQEVGTLGYNEIIEEINGGGWTYVWNDEQQVPHMYKDSVWVGFDDPTSVALKVEYAKNLGLGGVMVWAIETDDFLGLSGTKNPLLKAINTALGFNISSSTSASATTASLNGSVSLLISTCTSLGYVRDSTNCSIYYQCTEDTSGNYVANTFVCPNGLYFDLSSNICNWPSQVTDC